MKTCTKCLQQKPEEEFSYRNKTKGTRVAWCKACFSLYETGTRYLTKRYRAAKKKLATARRVRNRLVILEYLSTHPCVDCGETEAILLQFDHRPGTKKIANVSNMTQRSLEVLMAEIAKCDVRCGHCHTKRTAKSQDWHNYVR